MSLRRSLERTQRQRHEKQARRAARKVAWPEGFKGTVMWCPECYRELCRIPEGEEVPASEQQRVVDEHRKGCMRRRLGVV